MTNTGKKVETPAYNWGLIKKGTNQIYAQTFDTVADARVEKKALAMSGRIASKEWEIARVCLRRYVLPPKA